MGSGLCSLLLSACHEARGTPRAAVADSAAAPDLFRAGLAEPARLAGADGREILVQQFVRALADRDTATLRALVLSRAEFAFLYYPTAREALPPYELPPELMWLRLVSESEQGLQLALETFGGRAVAYAGHRCGEPREEGANTLWGWCLVEYRLPDGRAAEASLFGLIIERAGRYKFVSYANKL
jgi:hypothetical protein